MPTPEQLASTVNSYLDSVSRGDVAAIADLYASDATVEDPVGGEVHIGREAIRGFYSGAVGMGELSTEIVTLRALGHEAAFYWTLAVKSGDSGMTISIISTMTFDDDANITSMKAYWGPDDITPL